MLPQNPSDLAAIRALLSETVRAVTASEQTMQQARLNVLSMVTKTQDKLVACETLEQSFINTINTMQATINAMQFRIDAQEQLIEYYKQQMLEHQPLTL